TSDDLAWLLANANTFKLLDLGALPVTTGPASPLFPAWLELHKWLWFQRLYPEPEDVSLAGIFTLAGNATTPEGDIKTAIARLTQWKAQDLDDLAAGLGLQHVDGGNAVLDYARVETYERLVKCFKTANRVGAGTAALLRWADRDDDTNKAQTMAAQEIR